MEEASTLHSNNISPCSPNCNIKINRTKQSWTKKKKKNKKSLEFAVVVMAVVALSKKKVYIPIMDSADAAVHKLLKELATLKSGN